MDPDKLIENLEEEARNTHPFIHHPWNKQLFEGKLTVEQIREEFKQHFLYYKDIIRLHAYKVLVAEDIEDQRLLIPSVIEEAGTDLVNQGGKAHPFLYMKLAKGLGVTEADLYDTDYLPSTIIMKNEIMTLARSSLVEAIASHNIATESVVPQANRLRITAYKKYYGLTDDDLEQYLVHMEADLGHADVGRVLLRKHCRTAQSQQKAIAGLRRAIRARWIYYDGCYDAFVRGLRSPQKVLA